MYWPHARIHRADLRELIAASPIFGAQPPEPVMIACPRCGDEYLADLAPHEEPLELEAEERAALERLEGECPDHAHKFDT
jgi:hypothetical protein